MPEIVDLIGHKMGGRPAENLMHRLGMPISGDTILRQLKRKIPTSAKDGQVCVVGIDDWSWLGSGLVKIITRR
nr:hypothetical protein [Marinicella sp. W31]MDC2877436.1 hypothetical protein [Marinicella sp. W31]